MLSELTIRNFALMEDVRLSLQEGLSVFTGETGAGKSMLIDALGILLGGRASAEMVRFGKDKARIEGVFTDLPPELVQSLDEAGYPVEEGTLVLFRELNLNGRNTCRIQGRTVPLSLYRSLCEGLVDIHGQLEHQSLMNPLVHRNLLDALGGKDQVDLAAKVRVAARKYKEIIQEEQSLLQMTEEGEKRLDMLQYQIKEIDSINPEPGEEEKLQQEKRRIANAERISILVAETYAGLYTGSAQGPSAIDTMGIVRKALADLSRLDSSCAVFQEQADNIYFLIEELRADIGDYQDRLGFEPERLDYLEDRLNKLHKLRKYGISLTDVLQTREDLKLELEALEDITDRLRKLAGKKEASRKNYDAVAQKLTEKRRETAELLRQELCREMVDLGLDESQLTVHLEPLNKPTPYGNEMVEFYFTANLGEPPKPLAKVASGGEMSRLVLALKSLLAQVETVGTFVFDEVDSGVGGRTIQRVGDKLAKIAESRQVLCITHAPHVAAYADYHFGITKEADELRTQTLVNELNEAERIDEIARMLGGDQRGIARKHAEELWKNIR